MIKITAPVPINIIERPRLYHALDDALERPIIWIAGPGGCGKTTLIASYARKRVRRCLWYRVDASDADPGSLFHFCRLAAKSASPRSRRALPPPFAPEFLPGGLKVFSRRYFRELFAHLKTPFMMVFDNVNEVPLDAPFHDIIREGAAELPRSGHMVLVSRTELPPALVRFLTTRELSCLGWDDLRFYRHPSPSSGTKSRSE